MRLPKSQPTHLTRREYINALRRNGYRLLGKGMYASVLGKPGENKVVKVGIVKDDGYLDYVKKVGINSTNPLFPKIKSIEIFHLDCDDWDSYRSYYAVTMERLHKKVSAKQRTQVFNRIGICSIFEFDRYGLHDITSKNSHVQAAKKVLSHLYQMYDEDIHGGNIMYRVQGRGHQLVITDPVA